MFGGKDDSANKGLFGGGGDDSESSNPVSRYLFPEPSACESCMPDMTYMQRITGFCLCAALGYGLSLVGSLTLIGGFSQKNVQTFAALYVSGNVIALMATGFLMGPKKQCRVMWKATRFWTTAFYLFMLITVLCVAVIPFELNGKIYLILFLLFVQVCAAIWYSASYIPFGRDMISACFRKTHLCEPCYMVYDAVKAKQKENAQGGGIFGGNKA
jgi:hypothetical protein